MTRRIDVNIAEAGTAFGGGAYPVIVEAGLCDRLAEQVPERLRGRACMVVADANVAGTHAARVAASLKQAGHHVIEATFIATEADKVLDGVASIYTEALEARLDRGAFMVAVGGGIVGDVVGFAAATYLRGIEVIQVPTTLLAMVDASIGGKTGVNFPLPGGGLGKNLIGAFWQPAAVLADPRTLLTLQPRHLRCGVAESIKHAMIADPGLLEMIEAQAAVYKKGAIGEDEIDACAELIHRSQQVKVKLVEADVREGGARALLNLGHTFAHAIESIPELKILHGEAVAAGLVAACRISVETGRMTSREELRITNAIERSGFESLMNTDQDVSAHRLLEAMQYDKKTRDGKLRLVLPVGIGKAEVVEDVPVELVLDAWDWIGAREPK